MKGLWGKYGFSWDGYALFCFSGEVIYGIIVHVAAEGGFNFGEHPWLGKQERGLWNLKWLFSL